GFGRRNSREIFAAPARVPQRRGPESRPAKGYSNPPRSCASWRYSFRDGGIEALLGPGAKRIIGSFDCLVRRTITMGLSIRAYAKARGVSHVAVLKAAKAGRIPLEPDGTIDPAKADAAWQRSTDPGRSKAKAKPASAGEKLRPVGEAALGSVRETLKEQGLPAGGN